MTDKTQRNENILSRQVFPIPARPAPVGVRCINVYIPDDDEHMAIFFGAVSLLAKWNSWQRDPEKNGIRAANAWREALYGHPTFETCDDNGGGGFAGAGGGDDDPMIRQNPDNPCELQNSVDGVTWCTWADLSLCVPTGQPSGSQKQPVPGGDAVCYSGVLHANGRFLVPTTASTGDTIQLSKVDGAGTDAGIIWYCSDGEIYFGGACIGGGTFDGGDPIPTAHHMVVIAKIGSVYLDLTGGDPVTVPSGLLNEQITLQVNDADLTDNDGQYNVSVCVKNNLPADWSSTLNFQVQSYASIITSLDYGTWVLGSGYEGTPTGDPNSLHVVQIEINLDSCRITSVEMTYTAGGGSGPNQNIQLRTGSSYTPYGTPGTPGNGTGLLYGTVGDVSGVDRITPGINVGTTDVNCILTTLSLRGKGPKPSQLP